MNCVIAIFRTGGIGDVILSTVSVNIIKQEFPSATIIWFGRKSGNELIRAAHPGVDVYEIPSSNTYIQNLAVIKKASERIDAVIDLQHSARTIILGKLAAMHFNCSYTSWNKYSIERSLLVIQSYLKGRRFKFDLFKRELPNRYVAMALCTVKALNKMNTKKVKYTHTVPDLCDVKVAGKENAIAIGMGAKFPAKALPVEKLQKIIAWIADNNAIEHIYLLGDADQRSNAAQLIERNAGKIRLTDLCGTTSLAEAARVLSACKFAVVNDSGLAHLSEAVGTPVITFFGPTHQKFGYRPYLPQSKMVSADLGCRPCNKNGDVTCRYNDHACFRDIKDEQVLNAVNELLHA